MEDLLVLFLQFFFEVILQILAELPWDALVATSQPGKPQSQSQSLTGVWVVLSLAAGGGIGGLSLMLFPHTLLRYGSLRMANLLVAPAMSALLSYAMALLRRKRAGAARPGNHALYAACFTFALAIIRFTYATRA